MSGAPFLLAPLDATHDRTAFRSDSEPLNRYLKEQVTQDIRRRVAACFVALADGQRIAGYYTLASASLLLTDLPASTRQEAAALSDRASRSHGAFGCRSGIQRPRSWWRSAGRCARPCRPFGDCRLRLDGGRQGRGGSGVLPASRLHCLARLAASPCSCRWQPSSVLETRRSKPFEPRTAFENSPATSTLFRSIFSARLFADHRLREGARQSWTVALSPPDEYSSWPRLGLESTPSRSFRLIQGQNSPYPA
jgi:hypothetical protein